VKEGRRIVSEASTSPKLKLWRRHCLRLLFAYATLCLFVIAWFRDITCSHKL
jgi:hypothetical protein